MFVSSGLVCEMYSNYWRQHKWVSEILYAHDGQVQLVFYDEGDFVCSTVGTCDKENFCIELGLNKLTSVINTFSGSFHIKYKNDKVQFKSSDEKIQFVVTGKSIDEPNISLNIDRKIILNTDAIIFASEMTGKEYPLNFIYYDLDNKSIFCSSGYQIFGEFSFKNPTFAIPTHFSQMLPKSNTLEIMFDEQNIGFKKDNMSIKFKVFTPEKDISVYYSLISKNDNINCKFKNVDLLESLAAHVNGGVNEININISDNNVSISSVKEDIAAIKTITVCEYKGDKTFIFKPKELNRILNFLEHNEEIKEVLLCTHPNHDNIYMVYGDKYVFAVV